MSAGTKKTAKLLHILQHKKLLLVAFCAAVVLIGFGAIQLVVMRSKTTGIGRLPDATKTITEDVKEPVEKTVPADEYTVPADQPRMIMIPELNVRGPIQRVGVNKENAIAVPTNIHFAGWYTNSVRPGYPGLSVIDGHVSGRYAPGIFKQLTKLKKGSVFRVEYGNGTMRTFNVVEGVTMPEKEAGAFLLHKRSDIDRQLNLITCDGPYDRQAEQYNSRYIVVAKAVD